MGDNCPIYFAPRINVEIARRTVKSSFRDFEQLVHLRPDTRYREMFLTRVRYAKRIAMVGLICSALALTFTTFNVKSFGAVGDGVTMDTHAFQQAIDQATLSGKGVVEVPPGSYLSGTIHLKSHVELHLAKGATILGSPHRHDYDHGVWYSLIMAADVNDIAVTGDGVIDGQGAEVAKDVLHLVSIGELKIPPKGWRPSEVDRPEVVEITRCHKVRLERVTLKNSTCWVQTYRNCVDLVLKNVKVDSKTYWNNDGIDVVDCQKVHISDCDIDSNDDGICLKSVGPKAMCEDILVENCKVRSSASAVKFGTSSGGGFRHIIVRGIQIHDTFRSAVALESVDGGILEDVLVENIRAVHTGNAFFIRLGHRNTKVPVGRVSGVTLRNISVEVPAGRPDFGYTFHGPQFLEPHNLEPSSIVGHSQYPIQNVKLENIVIRMAGGGNRATAYVPLSKLAKVPERPTDYPEFTMFGELPSWGIYLRHVDGIKISNVVLFLDKNDYRPAIVSDRVHNLNISGVKVIGPATNPTVAIRLTKKIHVSKGIDMVRIR